MNQFFNWLAMGGYFLYVWHVYALVCVWSVMNLLGIKWQRLQTRKKLQQWFKKP